MACSLAALIIELMEPVSSMLKAIVFPPSIPNNNLNFLSPILSIVQVVAPYCGLDDLALLFRSS
ncbi:hypothetical protein BpHYR1_009083 [Brachionus plicatilis]|uniref:Uncharacterized protein n=1 Tax=Brachionus plicatilis TaxID=10195 RepID=A0A3M7QMD1_BRAPC|nr:hypothetical protein BpHYR1_009083 [Brachionus plicatilis]